MAEQQAQTGESGRKLPLKTVVILLAVLLIKGAAISVAFLLSGGPADVDGAVAAEDEEAQRNELIETLVVAGKFQNTKTNRSYLYDTEVFIKVRRKHQKEIEGELELKRAAITMAIATIIRSAEPVHLQEPKLATLIRQIKAALQEQLSADEDSGETKVEQVTIPKFIRYRSDL